MLSLKPCIRAERISQALDTGLLIRECGTSHAGEVFHRHKQAAFARKQEIAFCEPQDGVLHHRVDTNCREREGGRQATSKSPRSNTAF